MTLADRFRARAFNALEHVPGKLGSKLRGLNDAIGRPFAPEAELDDRRAFHHPGDRPAPAAPVRPQAQAAPVIVYHMDKSRRDALKLTEILDGAGIPYRVSNIQEDPAAQMAVRRDSKGFRLPVVFIAGEPVGGRAELTNLATSGELKKRVFG